MRSDGSDETGFACCFCRKGKLFEGDARAVGDIEQRMLAIRLVQQPEESHLRRSLVLLSADRAIEAAPAELRLSAPVDPIKDDIALENADHVEQNFKALLESLGRD
jgi:hypothetical protein